MKTRKPTEFHGMTEAERGVMQPQARMPGFPEITRCRKEAREYSTLGFRGSKVLLFDFKLLASRSCEVIHFCCLCHPVCGTFYVSPKELIILGEFNNSYQKYIKCLDNPQEG